MAAMALLVWACDAKKLVDGEVEEVVWDPDVLGGGLERLNCSAAGEGRAAHQVWCWSSGRIYTWTSGVASRSWPDSDGHIT